MLDMSVDKEEMSVINDAVDRGYISQAEGKALIRKALGLAENPSSIVVYRDASEREFENAQGFRRKIITYTGLGPVYRFQIGEQK